MTEETRVQDLPPQDVSQAETPQPEPLPQSDTAPQRKAAPTDRATQKRLLEATLFANNEPLTLTVLETYMGEGADLPELLTELQADYAERGINLVQTDGAWSFRTALDIGEYLKITKLTRRKLPRAAAEVLAIIAYHQPVTRAEIEAIRGVDTSKGTLDILLELGWVRPGKRRETPGRPLTWQTTPEFLGTFNLSSLAELPGMDDLKAAGLLDARPILDTLPREPESGDAADDASSAARDDEDFAAWIKEAPPSEA